MSGSLPPQAELDALDSLFDSGRIAEVVIRCENLVARFPDSFILHQMQGAANGMLGRDEQAASCLRRAVELKPDFAIGYLNLGVALEKLGHRQEAVACYQQVVLLMPDCDEAFLCLGRALHALGRLDEAADAYAALLRINPDHAEAHLNLGVLQQNMDRFDEAIASCQRAAAIRSDFAEAQLQLVACYEQVLRLNPGHSEIRSLKLYEQAHMCDWDALAAEAHLIPALGVSETTVLPFAMLALDDNPERNRKRSEGYAAREYPIFSPTLSSQQTGKPPRIRPDRIRIGYFSADIYDHATMHLMAGLFELHDRSRFAVHIFSYGPDIDDRMRQRAIDAVETFHDVRALGEEEIAQLARRERIDIAIDLKGFTPRTRLGIFARRAAPIQISYLGFPGTLGVSYIDHIVADPVVIPEDQRRHISEKILFLPNSYQVNDDRRVISDGVVTRTEMALPENGFVFCCFNSSYKISPAEFDIWMRLLNRVDGSVLWLFKSGRLATDNLRAQARRRGIDPDRLIFADGKPLAEHLARHALADLFLDTFNYNAHTTASDALWAGLPVVTKLGQGFAARVAGSLLTAIGLPELITRTSDEYEQLALALASDPDRLSRIRARLAANRLTAPLFDTALFTRHIETAYERAYEAWSEGRPPADIRIENGYTV